MITSTVKGRGFFYASIRKLMIQKDTNERREELLRPSCYLGYDRDKLGLYLLSRGAYKIAEPQFRRAIWLNPFEYRFVCHLAWCLYKQEYYKEAKGYIKRIDAKHLKIDEESQMIIERIKKNEK
jgi:tetratricopeptide (TPR) repeat protein